jgi:uncharacterized protein YbbK (DUF523 family)
VGINCKYSGGNNLDRDVLRLLADGKAIPVCPEQLGGCSTPRPAAEISGGTGRDVLDGRSRVVRENGTDVTNEFIKGAEETLKIARACRAQTAILKSGSPSCGCGMIYDGSFTGKQVNGNGVTAELLLKNGIRVITEKDIKAL